MDNKPNKKIAIIAGLIAVLIIIGVSVFTLGSDGRALKKQLDLGYKFLTEQDYEQAIGAFKKAIEIDPLCVEAYKELAETYMRIGDMESALEIASQGYENTKDEQLKELMESIIAQINQESAENSSVLNNANEAETIVHISELINCPTIYGVPWYEAGGASGMHSLFSAWDQYETGGPIDATFEEQGYQDGTHITYTEYETGRKQFVLSCDDGNRVNYDFWYTEESNGELARDQGFSVEYTLQIPFSSYADGFYQYIQKADFDIDEIVNSLGMDVATIQNAEETEYISDLGTLIATYQEFDDDDQWRVYQFRIRGEKERAVYLRESVDNYKCISMSIKDSLW